MTNDHGVIVRGTIGYKMEKAGYVWKHQNITRKRALQLANASNPLEQAQVGDMTQLTKYLELPGTSSAYYSKGEVMHGLLHELIRKSGDARTQLTYDWALPQNWVNNLTKITGDTNVSHYFVWMYTGAGIMGEPFALCQYGKELLERLKNATESTGEPHENTV